MKRYYWVPCLILLYALLSGVTGAQRLNAPQNGLSMHIVSHLANDASIIVIEGDRAYVGAGSRLVVWDISDPSTMHPIGQSDYLSAEIVDLEVRDGRAYALWSEE